MMGDRSAFFYGTLMAPAVLHRVCHGPSNPTFTTPTTSYLKSTPAVLHSHRRHRVKNADYPAVLPHNDTSTSTSSSSTVRGTYVTGLTDADLWRLDIFEGDEYERRKVKVRLLESNSAGKFNGDGNELGESRNEEVEAETYIWIAGADRLEDEEWDFEHFKKEKMRFWVDGGAGEQGEFAEVDQAVADSLDNGNANGNGKKIDGTGGRGLDGHIGRQLLEHGGHGSRGAEVVESAV